ncbi:S-adenosyl-L-methionine-dependent methyltransferase [Flagelloscypha sp. PMI_526]|nr:S-adenosyl-L-methionine-dependent methyltransferase [Flagelloscypha sp. PMI_526]
MVVALEFYSGIGGLHRAFSRSSVNGNVKTAYDWDQNATKVYKANHPETNIQQVDIGSLTADSFTFAADVWLLSPACQPYTVLNTNSKGARDPRAQSFLSLLDLLPTLVEQGTNPTRLLVENVAGFEVDPPNSLSMFTYYSAYGILPKTSTTREFLVSTLRSLSYEVTEFLLTPLQFGIPNSRLRYYCLAKLTITTTPPPQDTDTILRSIPGHGEDWIDPRFLQDDDNEFPVPQNIGVQPIRNYLDSEHSSFVAPEGHPPPTFHPHAVPDKVLLKWGRLFDIVLPSGCRTCCFTRGYTQLVERAGSILQTNETLDTTTSFEQFLSQSQIPDSDPQSLLKQYIHPLGLRYFTPTELLRLFAFSPAPQSSSSNEKEFVWPPDISTKTKYRLIGNSVNVEVVTALINYLFRDYEEEK